MVKKCVWLLPLIWGISTTYSMEKEPAKLTYVEDARSLSQEKGLYFNLLPKDILGIVQYYRLAEIIELKIAQAQDYNQALECVKVLAGEHAELFDNPTFIDKFISSISSKFDKYPAEVARDINTHGTSLWLTHIRPNQVKLLEAAERGGVDINTVQQLIAAGVNVNAIDNFGWTALMWAAYGANAEMLKELIGAGANVNARNNYGWTALMWAASWGHTEIVKALIAAEADVNTQNSRGDTALDVTQMYGDIKIVKLLEKAKNT